MKVKLYAVKDNLVGFLFPFGMQNDAMAKRLFISSAQAEAPNAVNTYPENKELWYLGEFDDQTGEVVSDVKYLDTAMPYVVAKPTQLELAVEETKEETKEENV